MANENHKQEEKQHFVEEVALVFEEIGIARMAGRILGWLLISNPPHQSADELAEALQASKGSISTMTRLLIQADLIERVGLPGERRDYFRMKPEVWAQLIQDKMTQITDLHQLAERGLELMEAEAPEQRQRLQDMHDLYAYVEQELPALLEHWKAEHQKEAGLK
ncbi:MAG TPA: MarR family transcriptional regulator [Anaerolineales bacterium]